MSSSSSCSLSRRERAVAAGLIGGNCSGMRRQRAQLTGGERLATPPVRSGRPPKCDQLTQLPKAAPPHPPAIAALPSWQAQLQDTCSRRSWRKAPPGIGTNSSGQLSSASQWRCSNRSSPVTSIGQLLRVIGQIKGVSPRARGAKTPISSLAAAGRAGPWPPSQGAPVDDRSGRGPRSAPSSRPVAPMGPAPWSQAIRDDSMASSPSPGVTIGRPSVRSSDSAATAASPGTNASQHLAPTPRTGAAWRRPQGSRVGSGVIQRAPAATRPSNQRLWAPQQGHVVVRPRVLWLPGVEPLGLHVPQPDTR